MTNGLRLPTGAAVLAVFLLGLWQSQARATDLTARQVTERLFRADPAAPPDFSNMDLRELDLSGLNFKGAALRGSDLFGADLSGADLSKTDLSNARLDRVILIGHAWMAPTCRVPPCYARPPSHPFWPQSARHRASQEPICAVLKFSGVSIMPISAVRT